MELKLGKETKGLVSSQGSQCLLETAHFWWYGRSGFSRKSQVSPGTKIGSDLKIFRREESLNCGKGKN